VTNRAERRRGPRRWDDERSGLLSFLMGVAYGIIVSATLYAWALPVLERIRW